MVSKMAIPLTISDILEMLIDYHESRRDQYRSLAQASPDEQTSILLNHLVKLDEHAAQAVRIELDSLSQGQATYLTYGARIEAETTHAADCKCHGEPGFQQALDCAFTSDQQLEQLIARLEDCSAARSVQQLAARLREMENIKDRQIANFTRPE